MDGNSLVSRDIILQRIRSALLTPSSALSAEASWWAIPRAFRRSSHTPANALVELFIDRLNDYDAQVLQVSHSQISETMGNILKAREPGKMLVPAGFPDALLPKGFDYVRDECLSPLLLDDCSGVITTCTLAIAETGTIVLQNAPGQGRRAASLVPDYHLCLVEASQVVGTVPEAIVKLHATATLPTTFISGPSATADIEMTRIKGVHGPRFLDVILIAR